MNQVVSITIPNELGDAVYGFERGTGLTDTEWITATQDIAEHLAADMTGGIEWALQVGMIRNPFHRIL